MKRPDATRRSVQSAESPMHPIVAPLALLIAALVLSIVAGSLAIRLWRSLPNQRLAEISSDRFQSVFDATIRSGSPEVRDGYLLAANSKSVAACARSGASETATGAAIRKLSLQIHSSSLARLHATALRIRELELRGAPTAEWWPAVGQYLNGIENANFANREHELFGALNSSYVMLGIGPGSASAVARRHIAPQHGAMAQYLAPRLVALVADRQQAGDNSAADTCRAVLFRWLRQWTLEPGAAESRLLAADLLARVIDQVRTLSAETPGTQPTTSAPAPAGEVADSLREWRRRYKESARAAPPPVLMSVAEGPDLAFAAHNWLATSVFAAAWIAVAAGVAGVVALALAWQHVKTASAIALSWHAWAFAAAISAILVAAILAYGLLVPAGPARQLRWDWDRMGYWPRFAFVAAACSAAAMFAAPAILGRAQEGRPRYLARLGALSAMFWLLLAACLVVSSAIGIRALNNYEKSVADAYARGPVETIIGPDANRLLDPLRAWQP